MAVGPDRQCTGVGTRLVLTVLGDAREAGAAVVWADARVSAVSFYERLGAATEGGVYPDSLTGPRDQRVVFDLVPTQDHPRNERRPVGASRYGPRVGTAGVPRLRSLTDPCEFLAVAGEFLAADPVVSAIVTSVTHRAVSDRAEGVAVPAGAWWLVLTDRAGVVVGAGMRTARSWPRAPFLLPMNPAAAVAVARELHRRGEEVLGVNGALPTVRVFADELARLGGGRVEVSLHTRLHELGRLVMPMSVPGCLRTADEQDLDLVIGWLDAFIGDADEQAGRPRGASSHEHPEPDVVLRQVRAGRFRFWCDPTGGPVSMVGATPPAFGVCSIGPVYTPPELRGRGGASNAVADLSRTLQGGGARVCLFTDQANPTSNRIYAKLGYAPVGEMANLLIRHD